MYKKHCFYESLSDFLKLCSVLSKFHVHCIICLYIMLFKIHVESGVWNLHVYKHVHSSVVVFE